MSVAIKEKPSRPTCALSLNVSVGEISTNAIRRDGVIDNSLVADGDLVRRKEGQIGKLLGDDPLEVLEVLEAFAGIGLDGGGFQKTIDFRILVTRTAKTMPSIAAQGGALQQQGAVARKTQMRGENETRRALLVDL